MTKSKLDKALKQYSNNVTGYKFKIFTNKSEFLKYYKTKSGIYNMEKRGSVDDETIN